MLAKLRRTGDKPGRNCLHSGGTILSTYDRIPNGNKGVPEESLIAEDLGEHAF